ncbi:hypothetical protein GCM10010250_37030 [Streptomyces althioticus]|nr:hypothetical protein GCM10010250_37030 [Streptomyces althioticus]
MRRKAHRVRAWMRVLAGLRAHTPGPPEIRRRIRPALSRGRAVLRYTGYRTDCDSLRPRHQTAVRRVRVGNSLV